MNKPKEVEEDISVVSIRVSKKFHKQLKQFGLDNSKSIQDIGIEALYEYLKKPRVKKK